MTFPMPNEWDRRLDDMVPAIDPRKVNLDAIAHFRNGDVDAALAGFAQAIAFDPNFAEAHNNRGLVFQMAGRIDEAVADFDSAIALRPAYPDALSNRARAHHAKGEHAAALADFGLALDACAGSPFAATVLHNRGSLLQDMGDLPGALADFNRALEIDPAHTSTYVNRGTARKDADDLDGALADFEEALRRMPHHEADLLHKRAGVKVLKNQFKEAVADYDQAISLEPENLLYYVSRGNARYHLREARGLADYRMAFRINLDKAAREIVRILVIDANRDVQHALDNCAQHLRMNGRDVVAHVRRGLVLVLLGDEGEAAANLDYSRAMVPDMSACLDQLVALTRAVRETGRPA